jgi:hypothetical protein
MHLMFSPSLELRMILLSYVIQNIIELLCRPLASCRDKTIKLSALKYLWRSESVIVFRANAEQKDHGDIRTN